VKLIDNCKIPSEVVNRIFFGVSTYGSLKTKKRESLKVFATAYEHLKRQSLYGNGVSNKVAVSRAVRFTSECPLRELRLATHVFYFSRERL